MVPSYINICFLFLIKHKNHSSFFPFIYDLLSFNVRNICYNLRLIILIVKYLCIWIKVTPVTFWPLPSTHLKGSAHYAFVTTRPFSQRNNLVCKWCTNWANYPNIKVTWQNMAVLCVCCGDSKIKYYSIRSKKYTL